MNSGLGSRDQPSVVTFPSLWRTGHLKCLDQLFLNSLHSKLSLITTTRVCFCTFLRTKRKGYYKFLFAEWVKVAKETDVLREISLLRMFLLHLSAYLDFVSASK